jgi:uncharacterized membrane protein YiaA
MKQHKTNLAILGLIMVFGGIPLLWNIGLSLITLSPQIYFNSVLIGVIVASVGFIIIVLFHSLTLGAGALFLAFGINRVVAGAFYHPSPLHFNPYLSHYASHYMAVGYIFIIIGIVLILISLFNSGEK